DTATVQIGVETDAATAKEALAQNSAQAQAVQEKLTKLGVEAKDIQTSNFSINPTYGSDGRQVTGYHVGNMVTVKIRQLDQARAEGAAATQAAPVQPGEQSFSVDVQVTFGLR